MNRKKISLGLLFLITALVVLPGASATPTYYGVLQSIYGGPTTCQLDCHTSTNGPPPFTTYGSLFSANASHFTDPTGVLKAIGPPLTSITVTPATAPLSVGGSQTFTAATLDPFGNSITATVTWTSSNTAVGTINPTTGVFTAVGAGTATITATGGGTGSGTITGNATATVSAPAPTLTLTLNTTVDGTSTPLVTNITSAVLLNTAGATVATATLPDTMTAQFSLSGITPGDYFIKVNGHAGALVPTRIDSTASSISQSVGLRLRNSVIGNISNPTLYRIKSYPSEIASSHAVVNYTTGLNETIYNFVIVSNSTSKIEVRVLGTDALMSSFSTTQINHDGYTDAITGLPVSFQIWILGDVKNPADPNGVAFLGNHGHLYNASTDPTTFVCSGCHPSLGTKPATFPPLTGFGQTGWCFRCHNGPGGPGQGFVDPLGLAPSVTPTPILVSAITPTSRNAVVGTPVTLFMSVINGGTATATNVGITQASSLPVTVSYTPWNGTAFTGPANTPVNIAGNNGVANFVLTINATSAFSSSSLTFNVSGTNAAAAPISGVNTLTVAATTPSAALADVIMISTNLNVSTAVNTPTFFAVATSNVGVSATGVSLTVVVPNTITGLATQVNQTNPITGAIIGPATGLTINAGAQPSFGVFLTPTQKINFDPTNNRTTLLLKDGSGNVIGAQSVAVSTT